MKRLFVAVKIHPDEKLLHAVQKIQQDCATEDIKWVKTDSLHITLKFLGDTPDKEVKPVQQLLAAALKDFRAFGFRVENMGYFGNSRFPRVLWLGIEEKPEWIELFDRVNDALTGYGKKEDPRAFKPHLTIGRVKSFRDVDTLFALEAEFAGVVFQEVTVSEVILFESFLKPTGPVYNIVEKFPFT